MRRILLVGALILLAGPAFAQVCGGIGQPICAITAPDATAVPLKPFFDFLQPILTAAVTAIVGVLVPIVVLKLNSVLHVSMTATQQDNIRKWAETQAGAIAAAATAGFSNEVIHSNDPRIVRAANAIIQQAPADLTALGVTPDKVQDAVAKIVQGEVGKLQQTVLPAVPPDPLVVAAARQVAQLPPEASVDDVQKTKVAAMQAVADH